MVMMIMMMMMTDDAGKADMVASGGDEIPVSATDAAMDTSSQPEQPPHAATSDSDNRDPMDDQTGTDTAAAADTAASDPEQQASCGTAMDTEQPTPGAATSTSSSDEQPSELPFQVQITYTDLDGAEAVRVLTQTQPVTRDRREAETSAFIYLFLIFYPSYMIPREFKNGHDKIWSGFVDQIVIGQF